MTEVTMRSNVITPTLESTEEFKPINSKTKVAIASFVGTTIEFYDFYIYSVASALFLGPLFFPSGDPALEVMAAFLSFGVAYIARPIGSILFGHFGDKFGRKTTLIASLLLMGISTTLIGLLPTYATAGIFAPILLCLMRFGQGLGIGGEWAGAALLATENAPKNKRAMYGIFPQLGPSVGFILASLTFIVLSSYISNEDMLAWGWRIPFIGSIAMVVLGLYIRLSLVESPAFQKLEQSNKQVKVPMVELCRNHFARLFLGTISSVSCFVLFVLITVFCLQYKTTVHAWQTEALFTKQTFLFVQIGAIMFMTLAAPVSAVYSEKYGRKAVLMTSGFLTIIVGCFFGYGMNLTSVLGTFAFLAFAFFAIGGLFSPLGAFLPEIFPTRVRYTGASLAFSFAGIIGGALTPFIGALLVRSGGEAGIYHVGYFLIGSAVISMLALYLMPETKNVDFME